MLTFVLLPRPLRPLAIVIGSFSVYISYAVGGVTDALFVPLLIGAVYRWDRFPHQRGPIAWRGPVLLGLAMAVKQTPWLVLPVPRRRHRARGVSPRWPGRDPAGVVPLPRLSPLPPSRVPNLPFVVMAPRPWLSGVLTPIASHTVPAGQGLVGLTLYLGLGGGSLASYTVALVVVFARPLARLRRHLPDPQGVGGGLPGDRAVLLGPLVRQLPGHPAARRAGGRHLDRPRLRNTHQLGADGSDEREAGDGSSSADAWPPRWRSG